jgi:His/Glu/Gln/Arg/opine family amino acid ABC transporter permease subunit
VAGLDFGALSPYMGSLLDALRLTILISVLAVLCSLPIGLSLAFLRTSRHLALRIPAAVYVEVLRNVPLLVIVYIFFYGLPSYGVTLGAFTSGLVALTLNGSAYLTEVFRGGLKAIPNGQYEAARSLGLPHRHVLGSVVIPQLFKITFPALGNQVVGLILGSALVSVIGIKELTHVSYVIGSKTFRYFEVFVVAGVMYVIAVQLINRIWELVGRRLRKGVSSS